MSGETSDPLSVGELELTERYLTPPATPIGTVCKRIAVPDDPQFFAAFYELISRLNTPYTWEERAGGMTALDAAAMATEMYMSIEACMIGAIFPYASENPPYACLPCDGSLYDGADYPALFAKIDPSLKSGSQFSTPDLRGRFVLGVDDTYGAFTAGGAAEHTLTTDEMPSHAHTTQPHNHAYDPVIIGDLDIEGAGIPQPNAAQIVPLVTENTYDATVTVNATGGGQPHPNMPPYYALKYCIVAK